MTDHTAAQPTWECRACGDPWPCASARASLRAEYAEFPTSLSLFMTSSYVAASSQLTGIPVEELFDRFFGWLRPRGGAS